MRRPARPSGSSGRRPLPAKRSPNAGVRDEARCSSSIPRSRSSGHFHGLAVANTSAPSRWASVTAASPTPPVAAWITTRSPALQARHVDERAAGGAVRDGHRRRRREAPAVGHPREQAAIGDGQRTERAGHEPQDAIADGEVLHAGTELDDDARAFDAELRASPR